MPERRVAVRVSVTGSDFGREMAEMSAEAGAASAAIRSIPNEVKVRARSTGFRELESDARRAERGSSALVDTAAAIWPALIPVTTLAVPALAGLAAQFTIGAGAAGVALAAFHGVGDALKALDAYQLEPTAQNLTKVHEAMSKLGPDGQAFVRELDQLEPKLQILKRAAESGLFPGATAGLDSLLSRLPQIRRIVAEISGGLGDLAGDAGAGLAGSQFDDFFTYLEHDAKPILVDLGHTIGNFTAGFAHLLVDLAPAERSFSAWLLDVSHGFNSWADGLDDTDGLRAFLDYVHRTGPEVADALSAIGRAFLAVAKAGAPISGPTLKALTALANLVTAIASSPIGSELVVIAAGLALVNRALAVSALAKDSLLADLLYGRSLGNGTRGPNALARTQSGLTAVSTRARQARTDISTLGTTWATAGARSERETGRMNEASGRLRGNLRAVGKGAAAIGAVTVASTGAADGLGLTNTATLALAGSMAGPWGAAAGAGVGLLMDINTEGGKAADVFERLNASAKGDNIAQLTGDLAAAKKQLTDLHTTSTSMNPFTRLKDQYSDGAAALKLISQGKNPYGDLGVGVAKAKLDMLQSQRQMDVLRQRAILAGQGLSVTAAGERELGESATQMAADLTRANDAISHQGDVDAYKAALDDLTASVKANGRTVDSNTAKGRANRAALRQIAAGALQAASSMSGLKKIRFLDGARDQFLKAARDAGYTRGAAKALAAEFGLLDRLNPSVDVKVTGIATARANIAQLQNALTGLHDRTVRINTVRTTSKTPMSQGYAGGGPILGVGGPRQDNIPIRASVGEYMMNAKAYSMYPREIEWINAQGLAAGGRVPPPPTHRGTTRVAVSLTGGTLRVIGDYARLEDVRYEVAGGFADQADVDHQSVLAGGSRG